VVLGVWPWLLVAALSRTGAAEPLAAPPTAHLAALGLTYEARVLTTPRPLRLHLVRVDLGAGKVVPRVLVAPDPDGAGPAETTLTPPAALIAGQPVVVYLNCNPWDGMRGEDGKPDRRWRAGQLVDISGLALSAGVERSPAGRGDGQVRYDATGRVYIGPLPPGVVATEGVEGWNTILSHGELRTRANDSLAPRTAIGCDATGRVLYLLVVDGRQSGYSEGMSFHEVATVLRDLGCSDAAMLDGGGSSILGLVDAKGQVQVVNRPSDRILGFTRVRPLPVLFTLIIRPTEVAP
jgi:hypothetical protein